MLHSQLSLGKELDFGEESHDFESALPNFNVEPETFTWQHTLMILHFRTRTRSETLPWREVFMDPADAFTKLVSKNFNQFAHAAENIQGHKLKLSPLVSVQKFSAARSSLRWFSCRNFQQLLVLVLQRKRSWLAIVS